VAVVIYGISGREFVSFIRNHGSLRHSNEISTGTDCKSAPATLN
jgi:hypothetical protein